MIIDFEIYFYNKIKKVYKIIILVLKKLVIRFNDTNYFRNFFNNNFNCSILNNNNTILV